VYQIAVSAEYAADLVKIIRKEISQALKEGKRIGREEERNRLIELNRIHNKGMILDKK
jgi:hypothetical protein